MNYKTAVTKLKKIIKDYNETDLMRNVAKMIIDDADGYETIDSFFSDLFQHGCSSGMIGGLIYYTDTHTFYDNNYNDIENLRIEYEQELGESITPKDTDLKNWFSWFAYEETARQIAGKLGV